MLDGELIKRPAVRAAVVLGCSRTVRGGLGNLYYKHRIRAAADVILRRRPKFLGQMENVPE